MSPQRPMAIFIHTPRRTDQPQKTQSEKRGLLVMPLVRICRDGEEAKDIWAHDQHPCE